MSVGAYIGIGIGALVAILLIASFLFIFIMSKKSEFVCDSCGHVYKVTFWELLLSPHMMWSIATKCPKCGEIGAHKL